MPERGIDSPKPSTIMVLSGFLGSGKTTLLTRLLSEAKDKGLKAAVIMNEIGEVSLDGATVQSDVPMTEIMDGCICCSVRGELALAIKLLVEEQAPDIVIVEATGLANPAEIIEAVTDTSLVMNTELRSIVTVIGADHFFAMLGGNGAARASSATLKLLENQVRVANRLVLNKTGMLNPEELFLVEEQIRLWNQRTRIFFTNYAEVSFDELVDTQEEAPDWVEEHKGTAIAGNVDEEEHLPHDHITVFTHRLSGPVKQEKFQRFIGRLPAGVYRAKGIVTFRGFERQQQLFQYSYRELSVNSLITRKPMPDVLVVMGEAISRSELRQLVLQLETDLPETVKRGAGITAKSQQMTVNRQSIEGERESSEPASIGRIPEL